MASERTPVIRKATSKEELAKLHPIERALVRLFEFMASIKLALTLMSWLLIECVIGTFVEAQINTSAARWLVYGNTRFLILLMLLAMNVLSAALIRFPWKVYQTGFVITHLGLLILLAGSLVTFVSNVDSLLVVSKSGANDILVDPDDEQISVTYTDRNGERVSETVGVDFGPFSWGHKIWGKIPWRDGYTKEYRLRNGDVLSIKNYLAHSERRGPTLRYKLENKAREVHMDGRLESDWERRITREQFGPGVIYYWQVDNEQEFNHFLHAIPKEAPSGLGVLAFSVDGHHVAYPVEELQASPRPIPGTDVTLEVTEFLPNAQPLADGVSWASTGDQARNPAIRVRVKRGEQASIHYAFAHWPTVKRKIVADLRQQFENQKNYGKTLARQFLHDYHFTYFAPSELTQLPQSAIHVVSTAEGKLAYRALSINGVMLCQEIQTEKAYPCWAGFEFTVEQVYPTRVKPLTQVRGESGNHAVDFELRSGDKVLTGQVARMSGGYGDQWTERLDDRVVTVGYQIGQKKAPFSVQLEDFEQPTNPGTTMAAGYKSIVTLRDETRDVTLSGKQIYMNYPLYYKGSDRVSYILYQSSIDWSTGQPISTFTVASDPGLEVKYFGSLVLCMGIFLMFYLGGYFRKVGRKSRQFVTIAPGQEESNIRPQRIATPVAQHAQKPSNTPKA